MLNQCRNNKRPPLEQVHEVLLSTSRTLLKGEQYTVALEPLGQTEDRDLVLRHRSTKQSNETT